MSQINDALKQARKAPPRNVPSAVPPLQPAVRQSSPAFGRILAALIFLLIIAAIFFIGWAVAHHTARGIVTAPETTNSAPDAGALTLPVVAPHPAVDVSPQPVVEPNLPKLQGIFYSATAPTAIIDGKTVSPGDQVGPYSVQAISKSTVTLIGPDKKEIKIGMDN